MSEEHLNALDQPVDLSVEGLPDDFTLEGFDEPTGTEVMGTTDDQLGPEASGAPPVTVALDGQEYSEEDVRGWRDRATQAGEAIASSTQAWQDGKKMTQEAQERLAYAQRLEQEFFSRPDVRELLEAHKLIQMNPEARENYRQLMGTNPRVEAMAQELGQARQAIGHLMHQNQVRDDQLARDTANTEIQQFQQAHPEFQDKAKLDAFMIRFANETSVEKLEHAYRILYWDQHQSTARQEGRAQVIQADASADRAGVITPSGHTEMPWKPNRGAGGDLFRQAASAMMDDDSLDFGDGNDLI